MKVAILGYGTVGSGVAEILDKNKDIVSKNAGEDIEVKYILDLRDFPGDKFEKLVVHDYEIILNDEEVKVVAEVMGGVEPAFTFISKALKSGKSVVTSNKELVEKKGAELLKIAEENNVCFFFEASVGGGIPIIRPLYNCLTADNIYEITGILNGTTNYMLTKMSDEGLDYDSILKDAQEKGYAERNPAADVEGFDTCRKIAILTSIVTGKKADFEDIYTEGITQITPIDIEYAKKIGRSIKLLATVKKTSDGKYFSMVSPVLVSPENPLYAVKDVFNAILVKGDMLGDIMFYGKGAGKLPTASAVVSDIEDAVKAGKTTIKGWTNEKIDLKSIEEVETSKLIRIEYNNKQSAVESVKKIFGISEIIEINDGEFAFETNKETEKAIDEKTEMLLNTDSIDGIAGTIRIEK